MFPLHNLLQPQPPQRHNLLLHMGVLRQNLRLGIVIVIRLRNNIARPPEIRRRHPPGIAQIPPHMVGVQMRMHHIVHLVRRRHIRVVDVHIRRQHNRPQPLIQIPGQIPPTRMRPRPHPRIHQNHHILRPHHKHPVVKLKLPLLQGIPILPPRAFRHLREHRPRRPRRRHHINDRRNLVIADGDFLCHRFFASSRLLNLA